MGKPISTLHVMIAALAVLLCTLCGTVFAAQSTADAVADVATVVTTPKSVSDVEASTIGVSGWSATHSG